MATVRPLTIKSGMIQQIDPATDTLTVGSGLAIGEANLIGESADLVITAPPGGQVVIRGDLVVEGCTTTVDCETKPCGCTDPLSTWRSADLDPCNRQ